MLLTSFPMCLPMPAYVVMIAFLGMCVLVNSPLRVVDISPTDLGIHFASLITSDARGFSCPVNRYPLSASSPQNRRCRKGSVCAWGLPRVLALCVGVSSFTLTHVYASCSWRALLMRVHCPAVILYFLYPSFSVSVCASNDMCCRSLFP